MEAIFKQDSDTKKQINFFQDSLKERDKKIDFMRDCVLEHNKKINEEFEFFQKKLTK